MLVQLFSNLFGGALTGYITNTLAIKMLFKKYPIVGGGVLASNFEEFVNNISELVERDLINHATLEKEFSTEAFKTELTRTMEFLLRDGLFNAIEDQPLQELPGFAQSLDNLLRFIEPYESELLTTLLHELSHDIPMESLLDEQQIERLSQRLFQTLYSVVEELLPNWRAELNTSSLTPADLLSQELRTYLEGNMTHLTTTLLDGIDKRALQELLASLNEHLAIDRLIASLVEQLGSQSIRSLIGEPATKRLSHHLFTLFIAHIQTPEGVAKLEMLSEALLNSLESVEATPADFISDEARRTITEFIETQLPHILEALIAWMQQNAQALEEMIESLIDTALQRGGVLGKIKYSVKQTFIGKVTERFSILERVSTMLRDPKANKARIARGIELFLDAMNNRSLGSIVVELRTRGWLNKALLTKMLRLNLPHFESIITELIDSELFEPSLESLMDKTTLEHMQTMAQDKLQPKHLSEAFEAHQALLSNWAAHGLQRSMHTSFDTFIPEAPELLDMIDAHQASGIGFMQEQLSSWVENHDASWITHPNLEPLLNEQLISLVATLKQQGRAYVLSQETHALFKTIADHPQSAPFLAHVALLGIQDNLHFLLEKNVSQTVRNELLSMGPAKLQERVEAFMGQELGPITWLGAGIGAGVGGALYAVQPLVSGVIGNTGMMAAIPVIYGATGILTNYLALKMLFQPYERKKFLGIPIPFTPGIVGKRKPYLAKNMSEFVDETLLSKGAIEAKLIGMRADLMGAFLTHLHSNDHAMINTFLQDHADHLAKRILDVALPTLPSWVASKNYMSTLLDTVETMDFTAIASDPRLYTKAAIDQGIEELGWALSQWHEANQDRPLSEALPSALIATIDTVIEMIVVRLVHSVETKLDDETFHTWIAHQLYPLIRHADDYSLQALLPPSTLSLLQERFTYFIVHRFQDQQIQERLLMYVQQMLINETHDGTRTLGSLFNESLVTIVQENLQLLFDHGLDEIITHLKAERSTITTEVMSLVRGQNNMATNAIFSIGGVFGDIKRFVSALIEEEIPTFLQTRQEEISAHTTALFEQLQTKQIASLGISADLIDTRALLPLVNHLLKDEGVTAAVTSISDVLIEQSMQIPFGDYITLLDLSDPDDFFAGMAPLIETSRTHLHEKLKADRSAIITSAQIFAHQTRIALFDRYTLNTLFMDLPRDLLARESQALLGRLADAPMAIAFEKRFVQLSLETLQREGIDGFVDRQSLQTSMEAVLLEVLGSEALATHLEPLLARTIRALPELLDERFVHYAVERGMAAAFDALEANLSPLISSIDFKRVIDTEINAMHPKEIEEMLNSFAKVYFNRLILYGGYGALFGIPVALTY